MRWFRILLGFFEFFVWWIYLRVLTSFTLILLSTIIFPWIVTSVILIWVSVNLEQCSCVVWWHLNPFLHRKEKIHSILYFSSFCWISCRILSELLELSSVLSALALRHVPSPLSAIPALSAAAVRFQYKPWQYHSFHSIDLNLVICFL